MIGPDDVGYRVVVRRIIGERNGRPLRTDLLGVLTACTDTQLTVTTAAGEEVTIDRASVVAGKRIPPPPPPRHPRRTDPG